MGTSRTTFASDAFGTAIDPSAARRPLAYRAGSACLRLSIRLARRTGKILASLLVFACFTLIAMWRVLALSDAGGAAVFGFASAVFWLLATVLSFRPVAHRGTIVLCNLLATSCAAAAACYIVPGSALGNLRLFLSRQ